jgi:MFS family permease
MGMALTVLGIFSAIYHPVGIPMLVQKSERPGLTIGVNGLAGNLGIALAALSTGFLVAWQGWRVAFVVPGLVSLVCGVAFAMTAPHESGAPAKKKVSSIQLPKHLALRTFVVMVATATTTSLLFNITTNGNAQLLAERLDGLVNDPSRLGILLAAIYAVASLAQLVVGRLLDRVASQAFVFFNLVPANSGLWRGLTNDRLGLVCGSHFLHGDGLWLYSIQRHHGGSVHRRQPCDLGSAVRALPFRLASVHWRYTCSDLW